MKAITRTITTATITAYTPEGEKVFTVPNCPDEKEAKRFCKRNDLYFLHAEYINNLYEMKIEDFISQAKIIGESIPAAEYAPVTDEETVEDE